MAVKPLYNESELLRSIAQGDQRAFEMLFNSYRKNVYTTAQKLTGNEWTAEEILQDTFLKVWVKRESLPEIENFAGWLYTIARNFTYTALKDLKKERQQLLSLTEDSLLVASDQTDHLAQEKDFSLILNKAIDRLPEKQKATYILIKQQEMKREEVARELNVSPETVKWNLEQAMKSIRAFCLTQLDEVPKVFLLYLFAKYL